MQLSLTGRYFPGMIRPAILLVILCSTLIAGPGGTRPTLTLNVTAQPPLNNKNLSGFVDQIVREGFHRIGIELKTVRLPAERGLISANQGLLDGDMLRIANIGGPQNLYPNLIVVPEKIMDWEFTAFSRNKVNLRFSWKNLAKKEVTFLNGWKLIERKIPHTARIVKVRSPDLLFLLLKQRRTQYVIYERWGGMEYIRNLKLTRVHPLVPPLARLAMYVYLNKIHKYRVIPLARAIRQMKQDGTYRRIYQKTLQRYAQ